MSGLEIVIIVFLVVAAVAAIVAFATDYPGIGLALLWACIAFMVIGSVASSQANDRKEKEKERTCEEQGLVYVSGVCVEGFKP